MYLVILPQALRTLIPPLTSQYLNIIKSTTLGAAIAYPDVLQIFGRTVLNQSGRAVEVMTLLIVGVPVDQPGRLGGDEPLEPAG